MQCNKSTKSVFIITIYTTSQWNKIPHLIYIEHNKMDKVNFCCGYCMTNASSFTRKTIKGIVHTLFWLVMILLHPTVFSVLVWENCSSYHGWLGPCETAEIWETWKSQSVNSSKWQNLLTTKNTYKSALLIHWFETKESSKIHNESVLRLSVPDFYYLFITFFITCWFITCAILV